MKIMRTCSAEMGFEGPGQLCACSDHMAIKTCECTVVPLIELSPDSRLHFCILAGIPAPAAGVLMPALGT